MMFCYGTLFAQEESLIEKLNKLNDKIYETQRKKKELEFDIELKNRETTKTTLTKLKEEISLEINKTLENLKDQTVIDGITGIGGKIEKGLTQAIEELSQKLELNENTRKPSYHEIGAAESDLAKLLKDVEKLKKDQKGEVKGEELLGKSLKKSLLDPLGEMHYALQEIKDKKTSHSLKGLKEVLNKKIEKLGIVEIPVVENETVFDPKLHNAIRMLSVTDPKLKGKILKVYKSGFMQKTNEGRLIEATMVVVGGEYIEAGKKNGACAELMEKTVK